MLHLMFSEIQIIKSALIFIVQKAVTFSGIVFRLTTKRGVVYPLLLFQNMKLCYIDHIND